MLKTIIKEIFITILLLIIMLLLLGILFYNNVSFDKVIPKVEAYKTPDKIKNEINTISNTEFQNEIITYQVTDKDLELYIKYGIYNPEKDNPFVNQSVYRNIDDLVNGSQINSSLNKIVNNIQKNK